MPLIQYVEYQPSDATQIIIDRANVILAEYEKQGFSLSLRQLYYQFVSRGWLANNQKNYSKLGDIVGKARESGLIDWKHIEDRGRTANSRNHFRDPSQFILNMARWYTIDLWDGQSLRMEVWLEKDALTDVVSRAADPWDVTYFANKGYCSLSAIWDAGHNRFLPYFRAGLDVVVLHLGDHDPSGIDMTRDIEDRLRQFSQVRAFPSRTLTIERIALNRDQVDEYDPPPNPAKLTDSRANNYIDIHGDESWELDALEPAVIIELIESKIREYVDERLFNRRKALEARQQKELGLIAENYDEIISRYARKKRGQEGTDEEDDEDND